MIRIVLKVEGMNCPMCEKKVNDSIRDAFSVKKVSSSHVKGVTELISDEELSVQAVQEVVEAKGFKVLSAESGPCTRGFLFWKK